MTRLLPFGAAALVAVALAAPVIAQESGTGQAAETPPAAAAPGMGQGMGMMGMGMMGMGGPVDFKAADANADGKLTREEALAWREAEARKVDADADGFVTAEELKARIMARMTARADEMARRGIEWRDDDGDGKLSLAELAPGRGTGRMFAQADTDGDGALTEAELNAARDEMRGHRGGHRGWFHGKGHGFGWWGMDTDDQE